ncbi:hypothetical protein GJW-30_1_01104 [Variibacter gotjawalensis]|uniref:Uncharacterized protein n=1 Tax=Variibacter gotjawalensis TaxID=1333996 RepID=A0A0S3PRH9_9BRAD|nr:hypothetical protein [Variibacter gotjawalensis]RZS50743.1 hypothetical protein EV661_3213 [Variibacter gotjawalensis]BAT58578.1 hypothetical protein GJW-30_1_01104 [Variibacter gotjawalensis]
MNSDGFEAWLDARTSRIQSAKDPSGAWAVVLQGAHTEPCFLNLAEAEQLEARARNSGAGEFAERIHTARIAAERRWRRDHLPI